MGLFSEHSLGGLRLPNRIVMAPLTRCRAIEDNLPNAWMVEYYRQRASAGLIITEGTSPSPNGLGYVNIPGLYNDAQMRGWQAIANAVHAENGRIFLQMMHTGRISHGDNLAQGGRVVAPSAIAKEGKISTYHNGRQPYPVPHAMTTAEVKATIQEFVTSAELAVEAGLDGVEIHSAHGYLPNQFISESSNTRTDEYGGSMENRCRFLLEITEKMIAAIGAEKVGLRISPFSYADVTDSPESIVETYTYLTEKLQDLQPVYMHLSHIMDGSDLKFPLWKKIREIYTGTLIICGDFNKETATAALQENRADLIAFGQDYIANPDLVERFQNDYPLVPRDKTHWYTPTEKGYTDYGVYQV